MENFLNVISTTSNKGDGTSKFREHFWSTVFDSLQNLNEAKLRDIDKVYIAKFLLASLQRYECNNKVIIRDILKRYANHLSATFLQFPLMHSFFYVPYLAQNVHSLLSSKSLDHIIIYKDEFTYVVDSMDLALEYGEHDFVIYLIKYGLFVPEKIDLKRVTKCVDIFLRIWVYMNKAFALGEALISLVSEFLLYISLKHPEFKVKRPKIHVVFILRILEAIVMKLQNDPKTEEYVKSVKLFYRIIPEPYVSCDDVKDVLLFMLHFVNFNDNEKIIETYLATYIELFGTENTASYTPRSLKHLARCVIRNEIIKSSKTVQTAVHSMCLPVTLKQLLVGASE